MTTLQITHSSFINHDTGEWHPERPERMKAIEQALSSARFQNLITVEAPAATPDQVARAHPRAYVDQLEKKQPKTDLIALDDALDRLEEHDPQAARLIMLRHFAGLSHHEAADVLGISRGAADRLWALGRAWLFRQLSK